MENSSNYETMHSTTIDTYNDNPLPLGCSPMKTFAMGATIVTSNIPLTHTKPNKEK
jgi:hypothetical protein